MPFPELILCCCLMTQVFNCRDEFFRLELEGGMVLVMLATQARADTTLVRALTTP